VADEIARLLAIAPLLQQPPSKDVMWANLEGCVRDLAGGNAAHFGRAAGLSAGTLVQWFAGRKLPAFASLNRLCYRLGIPLFRFLTERLIAGDPDWENARGILGQHVKRVQLIRSRPAVLPRPDSTSAGVSHREIKRALQSALRENPLPTVRQIAWRLGIHPDRIYRRFPDFHKALSGARQSRLEAAAKAALLESPPPTLREFEKQQRCCRKTLRICFPGLFRELAVRSSERHHRKRDGKESLAGSLCRGTPPSGHALAARLETARVNLRKAFPEIWESIVRRHAEYQKQEALAEVRHGTVESNDF
jgi:transcriptional regulator with XRE-family HTH domain